MERNTLGAVREQYEGTERGTMFDKSEALYRKHTKGRTDFDEFRVKKPGEMARPDAIGTWTPSTDEKALRTDATFDLITLTHTTIHEAYHQNGMRMDGSGGCGSDCCFSDGFIEHKIHRDLGEDYKPVPAYLEIATAAGKIVDEIGEVAYDLASQGAKSEALLTAALVEHRLAVDAANDDVAIEQVVTEARNDVRATFAKAA